MLPEPWCQFCHRKVDGKLTFDYDEHHAILDGIADGLTPWCSDKRAWSLHQLDWWYYNVARKATTIAVVLLLARFLRRIK